MTVGMVIGLTIFTLTHRNEIELISSFAPYIYVVIFSTAVMGIVMMALKSSDETIKFDGVQFLYCEIGVILFSLFLMYDIQLITGG